MDFFEMVRIASNIFAFLAWVGFLAVSANLIFWVVFLIYKLF